ncbi:DUF1093 domain-containing protein [Gracilibacillus alcaliphilus]|uniref:DUF1093 domain-containing protein n=1 Tax=Gracilibacillus alcaliphilus TaxID=1401441 RepID=UPI00195778F8|nr:DUF1093 domain-containing protein [Gracilibacillus alcaliphilus]MBM7676475.1 uncharacterized protein YxeA [Gracilibacillus alcaliphilus]
MKKIGITLIGLLIFLTLLLIGIQKTTSVIIPLSDWTFHNNDEKVYYVKTTEEYETLWNGNLRYQFSGFDEDGEQQKIYRVIDKKLKSDAYLKIYAAGSYGKG